MSKGEAGGLVNALIPGPTKFLILAFHRVWRGPERFVMLIGVYREGAALWRTSGADGSLDRLVDAGRGLPALR